MGGGGGGRGGGEGGLVKKRGVAIFQERGDTPMHIINLAITLIFILIFQFVDANVLAVNLK